MQNAFVQQQQPFAQPGFPIQQFPRSAAGPNKKLPRRRRRRRQLNIPPNGNFQQQQFLPIQQQQQILPIQQQQQILPIQQQQQILPIQQQQQILPIQQQQQILPIQQQQPQILPNQQLLPNLQQLNPTLNPNYYQMSMFPSSAIFQNGQSYPTMDPQFYVQAQISPGPSGNGIYKIILRSFYFYNLFIIYFYLSGVINWSTRKFFTIHSYDS
jgi:hypothetical protein